MVRGPTGFEAWAEAEGTRFEARGPLEGSLVKLRISRDKGSLGFHPNLGKHMMMKPCKV